MNDKRKRELEGIKKLKDACCRHFTGIQNKVCEMKMQYAPGGNPCFADGHCPQYSPLTADELEAKYAAMAREALLLKQGLSSCCDAPLNTAHVITTGRFKNHGPRFCSKCGQLAFMV